jgi:hypothetical protein
MTKNYLSDKPQISRTAIKSALALGVMLCSLHALCQQTYTFTNCGATGSLGPTQTQVNNTYTLTNLMGSVGVTTTGIQTWTVPSTGLYRVVAYGASSGQNSNSARTPGLGAIMQGDFSLNGGDVLQILVGQMGENHPSYAAGGGGGTFVTKTPHNTLASILVVAGGGGAPSGDFSGLSAVTATCGTFDVQSGPAQCSGDGGISFTGNSGGGGGGFFTDGAGNSTVANGGRAYVNGGAGAMTNNTYVRGGFGGGGGNASPATSTYASNGGGGFSGGNGGNRSSTSGTGRMGGGGGGSYNNGANQINTVNTSTGHGKVLITELCNISIISSSSGTNNAMICSGASLTLTTNAVSNYSWSTGSTASSIVVAPSTTTVYGLTGTSSLSCVASTQYTVNVSSGVPVLTVSTSTTQVCLGKTVTLTATGALTYTWSHNVTNGASYSPSVTTTYTVNGQNGCGISSSTIAVTVGPLPVSVTSSTTDVCVGGTAVFTVNSAATSYTWMPQNTSGAGTTIAVSPTATTVYTVTATDGTCFGTATPTMIAKPLPTISIVPSSNSICLGEQVTMTVTGAGNYSWTPSTLSGPVVADSPTTTSAYQVSGTNSLNCASSTVLVIFVNYPPVITTNLSSTLVCSGNSVVLTASGAQTYTWSQGGNGSSATVAPQTSTVYNITGGQSTNTCVTTKSYSVDVVSPILGVTPSTAICDGAAATLSVGPATNINWSHGFGPFTPINVTPSVTTVYTVTGDVSTLSIVCPASATVMVTVNPNPTVTASASRTLMCKGESVVISAGGAASYSWSTNQSGGSITFTSNATISHVISVTGSDANGCAATASVEVKVNTCQGIATQNADGSINVFPVPSHGELIVQGTRPGILSLTNQLGQQLKEIELDAKNNYRVTISGLAAGTYYLKGEGIVKVVIVN